MYDFLSIVSITETFILFSLRADIFSLFISRERKRENQAQLDKVQSLYRSADLMSSVALHYPEVCPICPGQLMLNTRRQLYLHLYSKEHQDREEEAQGIQDDSSTTSASTYQK